MRGGVSFVSPKSALIPAVSLHPLGLCFSPLRRNLDRVLSLSLPPFLPIVSQSLSIFPSLIPSLPQSLHLSLLISPAVLLLPSVAPSLPQAFPLPAPPPGPSPRAHSVPVPAAPGAASSVASCKRTRREPEAGGRGARAARRAPLEPGAARGPAAVEAGADQRRESLRASRASAEGRRP